MFTIDKKYILPLLLLTAGCADSLYYPQEETEPADGRLRINAEISQANPTRANDSGFADGDRIGVYGGESANVPFTFSESTGKWSGAAPIYWPDGPDTPMDVTGYYPYEDVTPSLTAHPFTTARNQAATDNLTGKTYYELSDFLCASEKGTVASQKTVNLRFRHVMACIQVTLEEGGYFDEGEWTGLDKSVLVSNVRREGVIDISGCEAKADASAEAESVIPIISGGSHRAVVYPQTIASGDVVISVTVDGQTYSLRRSEPMEYLPGKMHKFTIRVNKRMAKGDYEFELTDMSVTAWESDLVSHNGAAKEYLVVDVPEEGGLRAAVEALGVVPDEIVNLKITGRMNPSDFWYIRNNLSYLEAINLKEVLLSKANVEYWEDENEQTEYTLPYQAFYSMETLTYVELPDKLRRIGAEAFYGSHISGTLHLPEGLEYIGGSMCLNNSSHGVLNNLTGPLVLPGTLKYIGGSAFEGCHITGPLVFPEGLEVIGASAFSECREITGEIHLPHTLRELGDGAFRRIPGISGTIEIPRLLTTVSGFGETYFTSLRWPDRCVRINGDAFAGSALRGAIRIPETVTHIGHGAFSGSKISHISLPQKLETLEESAFRGCRQLQDTIAIPPLIETIAEFMFTDCEKLDAVIIPASVSRIKDCAFNGCHALTYIRCDAKTPPALGGGVFDGVEKDNFTLEVPEESVDLYRNAEGWREFRRISAYRNFVARPSKYNVLNAGGTRDIILNADTDWEMVSCPSWCHIDKTSGFKKTALKLTVDRMAKGSSRRDGRIVFRLKDPAEHETHINVCQYDYEYEEDSPLRLQKATKGAGIDLFFVGDAYDAADIASGGYLNDMMQEMEYFFAVEPYTAYRDYFNVYTSFARSEDSGCETLNTWRETKFSVIPGDGVTRLSADWEGALNYCAATVPAISSRPQPRVGCILVGNTELYEGVTYLLGDTFCSVVTKSTADYPYDARGLIQHEAGGHGIGWLADEYVYHRAFIQKCPCVCCGHVESLENDHAGGFGLNLWLSGKYKDVPWSHLIFNPGYGDIVDIYEGGYFHSRGVYRSEYNSCMNNNVAYFSSWSRQLIVQRIMKLAGEQFSLERFYANDSREIGKDFTGTRTLGPATNALTERHGNAPVFIKNYRFGKGRYKKGGGK